MSQRILVDLVEAWATTHGITVHRLSHGWILLLQKNGETRTIFGYDFDLNSATAQMLAKDKSATALLLQFYNVPCVEHHLFLRPDNTTYVNDRGNWATLRALAEAWDYNLVCKPNHGTSGQDVYHVCTPRDLEWALQRLFQEYKAVALSPYYAIRHEVRVILADGEPLLVYEKRRPEVVADGVRPIGVLVLEALARPDASARVREEAVTLYRDRWDEVPPAGTRLPLIWRHNLAAGAMPVVWEDPAQQAPVVALARRALNVLGLRVAAVDVIQAEGEEGWRILEVNSGIMMEYFARKHPQGREIALRVYTALLERMFPTVTSRTASPRTRHKPN